MEVTIRSWSASSARSSTSRSEVWGEDVGANHEGLCYRAVAESYRSHPVPSHSVVARAACQRRVAQCEFVLIDDNAKVPIMHGAGWGIRPLAISCGGWK